MSECYGCLTAADIGLPGNDVAYAHPHCPEHGDGCSGFEIGRVDLAGRMVCANCNAYQVEHDEQMTPTLFMLEWQRERVYGYESGPLRG